MLSEEVEIKSEMVEEMDVDDDPEDSTYSDIEIKPELLQVELLEENDDGRNPIASAAKFMRATCNSESCVTSAKRHCNQFTEENRKHLFEYFWNFKTDQERREFVVKFVDRNDPKERKQNSRRHSSYYYHLPLNAERLAVCKTMFVHTLATGPRTIRRWMSSIGSPKKKKKAVELPKAAMATLTKKTMPMRGCKVSPQKNLEEEPEEEAVEVEQEEEEESHEPVKKPKFQSIPRKEMEYYRKRYADLGFVVSKRIHCTVCKLHIGTAPCQLELIRTHPELKVSVCKDCFEFYINGVFTKGEDGSEYYCRWCGQGGEVLCCSVCSFVFCKECIDYNLSEEVTADIRQNDLWQCFYCDPKILWPLRAQHWAALKFMRLQRDAISSQSLAHDISKHLMKRDSSSCCPLEPSTSKQPVRKKAPLYHTINGFKVDLNAASQNGSIRLPNGKVIHVKKTVTNDPVKGRPVSEFTISVRTKPAAPPAAEKKDTAYSKAKGELDSAMGSCKDICDHLAGKIRDVHGLADFRSGLGYPAVSRVYTQEAFLLSYSIGKLQLLQEEFRNNLRKLGYQLEADNLEKGRLAGEKNSDFPQLTEDDDFEIVEQKQEVINLESDDEEEEDIKPELPKKDDSLVLLDDSASEKSGTDQPIIASSMSLSELEFASGKDLALRTLNLVNLGDDQSEDESLDKCVDDTS